MNLAPLLLRDADLCVKCGLCLPRCPTYLETQHEADSPRGRIALIQGLAAGTIPLSPALEQHLDGCLSCRACESVCPAQVPYGRVMDGGRELLAQQRPARVRALRWLAPLLTRRAPRAILGTLLWLYQRSRLELLLIPLVRGTRLGRLHARLPRIRWPTRPVQSLPADAPRVALFTGCTGAWMDGQTLHDAVRVLNQLGYAVDLPAAQQCCGALHQHGGLSATARDLARANTAAFAGHAHILSFASGCGATLKDYADLLSETVGRPVAAVAGMARPTLSPGSDFAGRVQDLSAFILRHWNPHIGLTPLRLTVALHTPCTARNVLKSENATRSLLEKIPGLDVQELDAAQHCCGAAGAYLIQQPEMADVLLARKVQSAVLLKPDYLVSANIGCSLHLAAGLRGAGLVTEVLHPVSLLARALNPPPS